MSKPSKQIKLSVDKSVKLKNQFQDFKEKQSQQKQKQQKQQQKTKIKKQKIQLDSDFEVDENEMEEVEDESYSQNSQFKKSNSSFSEDYSSEISEIQNKKTKNNKSQIKSTKKETQNKQKQVKKVLQEESNQQIKKPAKKSKKDLQKLKVNDVNELIELIKNNTKQDFKTDYVEQNKVRNSIGMKGCQANTYIEMTRPGEYYGLGLIVLEKSRGILHSERIIKSLQKTFIDNNLQAVVEELQISDIVGVKGLDIIYFILYEWLNFQGFPLPPEIQQQVDNFEDLQKLEEENYDLIQWVQLGRHSPLIEKVKIAQLGEGKNGSYNVVPESWMDKEFEGTNQLHEEMQELDWRRGKPKITFCAIYSTMTKIEPQSWCNKQQILKNNVILSQKPKNFNINLVVFQKNAQIKNINSLQEFQKYVEQLNDNLSYIVANSRKKDANLIIAIDKNQYFNEKQIYKKSTLPVGVCISRIQKAMRQGKSPIALIQALEYIQYQRPYTLPENNFRTVSPSRQLLWRTFIILLEDSRIYMSESNQFGLKEIVILSIICQLNSDIQINEQVFQKLVQILLKAQDQTEETDIFNWRDAAIEKNKKIPLDLEIINEKQDNIVFQGFKQLKNTFKLAINYQPMMSGDEKMISQSLQILQKIQNKNSDQLLKILNSKNITFQNPFIQKIPQYLEKSDIKIEKKVLFSAFDHHCKPNMILKLQGSLPFVPEQQQYDTKEISKFIWNFSSSYNIRTQDRKFKFSQENQKYILYNLQDIQKYLYYNYEKNTFLKNEIEDEENQIEIENLDQNQNEENNQILENLKESQIKDQNQFFSQIIQELYEKFDLQQEIKEKQYINKNSKIELIDQNIQNEFQQENYKIAFLSIFGFKQKFCTGNKKYLDAIISGETQGECVKIKKQSQNQMIYLEEKERFEAEQIFVNQFKKQQIPIPELQIEGYEWIYDKKQKKIEIDIKLVKSNKETFQNFLEFYVNGIKLDFLDASPLIKKIKVQKPQFISDQYKELVQKTFYTIEDKKYQFKLNLLLREIAKQRNANQDFVLYDWYYLALNSILNKKAQVIWKHVLVKIENAEKNYVTIGPVDRNGKKQQNSISYQYEGFIWRLLNLFSALYPRVVIPKGDDKFKIEKQNSEFLHFKQTLLKLAHQKKKLTQEEYENQQKQLQYILPKVTTKLWEHQFQTSQKITQGFTKQGKKGFGDASCVGAGKTLSAISVMINLLNNNLQENKLDTFKGFLVLIPYKTLFDTWTQEIKKHTKNVDIVLQNANGTLTGNIKHNTIVISTLARAREHPFHQSWVLVVIDECLAVQRREALQTEEAWRQVICSQYGVLMMSATFFRSRFDQLFFMLKMLRTQLQENKEFLDCLLNQSMICYISEQKRKWNVDTQRIQLSNKLMEGYNKIKEDQNIESDKLYMKLADYLFKNYNILNDWKKQIKIIEKENPNSKILIYAKSKEEANMLSENLNETSRFPDVSGKHVVASYHEATFGINTLVKYNTIMTRPPEPDKLPQMKGRLDRQGQQDDVLNIVYLVLQDTIEEASLFRLELCEQFLNHYIMPLATFYDYAVGKKEFKK